MGIEDRDWYAEQQQEPYQEPYQAPYEEPPKPPRRFGFGSVLLLVVAFLVMLAVVGIKWMQTGSRLSYSGEKQVHAGDVKIRILPGLPELTLHKGSLYPPHDPWKSYLADAETCPGGERTDLPLDQQANIMVCLINYARQKRGLQTLITYPLLNDSSLKKADKIVNCQDFAHNACGEDPAADARAAGYDGDWGENLYVGEGRLGAPRVALDGWLNSPGHRANLFEPEWRSEGIAVMHVDRLGSYKNATLWVNEFASR